MTHYTIIKGKAVKVERCTDDDGDIPPHQLGCDCKGTGWRDGVEPVFCMNSYQYPHGPLLWEWCEYPDGLADNGYDDPQQAVDAAVEALG